MEKFNGDNQYSLSKDVRINIIICSILTFLILLASGWIIYLVNSGMENSDPTHGYFAALFLGIIPGVIVFTICLIFQIVIFIKLIKKNKEKTEILNKIKKIIIILILIDIIIIGSSIIISSNIIYQDEMKHREQERINEEIYRNRTQTPWPDEIKIYGCEVKSIDRETNLIKVENCETVQGNTENKNNWLEFNCLAENCIVTYKYASDKNLNNLKIGQKVSVEKSEYNDGSSFTNVYILSE